MAKIRLEFSAKEVRLLNVALFNGAGDDAIENLGLSKHEQRILGNVANRLLDAVNSTHPRFYVEEANG